MSMPHRTQRQHCFLCDLPRTPWAILHDFSETVCRGCVNYEGPDRIEMIIEAARQMKRAHGFQERTSLKSTHVPAHTANARADSQNMDPPRAHHGPPPMERFSVHDGHRAPNVMDYPRLPNGLTLGHSIHRPDEHLTDLQRGSPHLPRGIALNPMPAPLLRQPHHGCPTAAFHPPISNGKRSDHDEEETLNNSEETGRKNGSPEDLNAKPSQVKDTLNILATAVPFEVRFKKDPSLLGRVFSFDVGTKHPIDYELKVYLEYPRGSGTIYNGVSSVVKQMHRDCQKDCGKGLASGYKYLEYEMKHGSGDWRMLSDMLTEPVRFFRESVQREWLPTPYVDNNLPSLPSTSMLARGPNRKNTNNTELYDGRKRKSVPEDEDDVGGKMTEEHHKRQQWMQNHTDALKLTAPSGSGMSSSASHSPQSNHTSSPPDGAIGHNGPSPMAALMNVTDNLVQRGSPSNPESGNIRNHSSRLDGHSPIHPPLLRGRLVSTFGPVPDGGIGISMSESTVPSTEVLRCTLCHERLEDTHFVQCPSVSMHKFCFPCSKESIKSQGSGSEVYCPSGKKCPLAGSNVPWAFMPGEIVTILGDDLKETKIKTERDA